MAATEKLVLLHSNDMHGDFLAENKGTLNIIEGEIEISKTIAKGSTISSIKYKNKTYYVNVKTGKLVPNAWQKKK